jgi:anti-anti-sigma factor
MSFEANLRVDEGSATVTLAGELDARSAPRLNDLIISASERPALRRLVLLMEALTYMSSAGLRCLVFAHQKMPREVEIVLVGTRPQVAETIRLTGFDRSVVMQEAAET